MGTGREKVEKTMTRVGFRIGTLGLLLAIILSATCPASEAWAMGWDGNFWSWSEVFSRSPEAVRGQLNALLKEFRQEEGGLKGIYFKRVDAGEDKGFRFLGKEGQEVLAGQHVRVSVEGKTNTEGEVETLSVCCRPAQGLSADFDEESFQIMRMALMALFDDADESQSEALSLLYIYDLRPYLYEKGDKELPAAQRDVGTVADGLYVKAVAESKAEELCLTVNILGQANEQQIQEARLNDQSNRVMDQSVGELVLLKECAWELAGILPEVQKDEMEAILEQMEVSLSVLDELNMDQYAKCKGYAEALDQIMEQMNGLIQRFRLWMNQPEAPEGETLEAQILDQVNQIKQLSELIQMC